MERARWLPGSIQYSPTKPKYVAFSETTYPNDNETKAIMDLQALPGLYKVFSILDRKDKDGKKNHAFISKYYSRGDLSHFMKKYRKKISFNDKIRFARDILIGLESMHTKGYAHRDLGLKNYFVERRGKKFVPVIADFGRAAFAGETLSEALREAIRYVLQKALITTHFKAMTTFL